MKLWELKIKYETGEEEHITGFLSKKQIDDFVEQHKKENNCSYTKKEFEGTKLDATFKEFFEFFKIPEQEITLQQRECLEYILCSINYETEPIKGEDSKLYPIFDTYSIEYVKDQWWVCNLLKGKEVVCSGEGNSVTEALCSLCILKSDLFTTDDLIWMKEEVFKSNENN